MGSRNSSPSLLVNVSASGECDEPVCGSALLMPNKNGDASRERINILEWSKGRYLAMNKRVNGMTGNQNAAFSGMRK